MAVRMTKDVEKERATKTWELLQTRSLVKAAHTARDLGWKENKVQVRYEETSEGTTYFVEPYERGCGCKGILKYRHYFD